MEQVKPWVDTLVTLLTGGWPVAAVVLGIIYRTELREMLPRLRKAGPIELAPLEQQIAQEKQIIRTEENTTPATSLPELEGAPRSEAIAETEREITAQMTNVAPDKVVPYLSRALATTAVWFRHERAYYAIFGSQIALLKIVNIKPTSEAEASAMYEAAKRGHPELYANVAPSSSGWAIRWRLTCWSERRTARCTSPASDGTSWAIWH